MSASWSIPTPPGHGPIPLMESRDGSASRPHAQGFARTLTSARARPFRNDIHLVCACTGNTSMSVNVRNCVTIIPLEMGRGICEEIRCPLDARNGGTSKRPGAGIAVYGVLCTRFREKRWLVFCILIQTIPTLCTPRRRFSLDFTYLVGVERLKVGQAENVWYTEAGYVFAVSHRETERHGKVVP